jgi:hypothetical protein
MSRTRLEIHWPLIESSKTDRTGYPWKTGSGYTGLTLLFWSNTSQEFLSWSEARPTSQGFDPRQRFYGEGPWDGAQNPRQVASSYLKLRNARRTASGRISGSTKTSALVLTPTPPSSLQFDGKLFNSWVAVHQYARNKQPLRAAFRVIRVTSPSRWPNSLIALSPMQPSALDKVASFSEGHEGVFEQHGEPIRAFLTLR